MITVEQLNAVPGRPHPIGEWKQYYHGAKAEPGHLYTEDNEFWDGTSIAILTSVEVSMSDAPPSMALAIAEYAQRVESEIKKWKSQQSF